MNSVISVIVPCFNYGHFIPQTLQSVQAQTYPHWECIVVDDGSTDDTASVVKGFAETDPRIRYIHQSNQGLSAARNTGIRASHGEYFQFLDSDDLIEPEKLDRQVAYLREHPEVDLVYGDVRYFHTDNLTERRRTLEHLSESMKLSGKGVDLQTALAQHNITVVNAPLLRRSYLETVGAFDDEIGPIADWNFWLRGALKNQTFHFLDVPNTLALVRYHSTSMSASNWRMIESTFLMHRKLVHWDIPPRVREIFALGADHGVFQMREVAFGEIATDRRAAITHLKRMTELTHRRKFAAYATVATVLPAALATRLLWYFENVLLRHVGRLRGKA